MVKMTAGELAKMADEYYKKREKRLAEQRKVDEMKKAEDQLRANLIATLEHNKTTAVGGKLCQVELAHAVEPTVTSWEDLYDYIRAEDRFDLLYRRVNSKAVKEIWDNDLEVPGVSRFTTATLSVHKK